MDQRMPDQGTKGWDLGSQPRDQGSQAMIGSAVFLGIRDIRGMRSWIRSVGSGITADGSGITSHGIGISSFFLEIRDTRGMRSGIRRVDLGRQLRDQGSHAMIGISIFFLRDQG